MPRGRSIFKMGTVEIMVLHLLDRREFFPELQIMDNKNIVYRKLSYVIKDSST